MQKTILITITAMAAGTLLAGSWATAQVAGTPGKHDLVIAENGQTAAIIAIAPAAASNPAPVQADVKTKAKAKIKVKPPATPMDRLAAEDLATYIERMSGAKPVIADTPEAVDAALQEKTKPVFLIGALALQEKPGLAKDLAKVSKKNPILRADAIVLKRNKNRIYLAGSNEDSHYFAVADLLHRWGCRWFMQTEFGECIPEYDQLRIGELDYAYGSPFEIRKYWISWVGDYTGFAEFKRRNMMNNEVVPSGHCLAQYTRDIAPGGNPFKVAISDPATAAHVANQLTNSYAKGSRITLGMEDGTYSSDYPRDKELLGLQYDKYFMLPSVSDAFLEFYNNVADILMQQYPDSTARIGFLIYANFTLPPVRPMTAKKPLVGYLAPIDIDPIHGMDDPKSPPRREYRDILYAWAKIMEGRVAIYDYDQGMLVWRDIPNPSLASIRQDIQHYRKAGILGIDTESRGAVGTTFINLYLRGRLMWNPDEDVDALLAEFYPAFYGPAAEPMAQYWNAVFKAWADTVVTEHEYFVAPAIYTPELMAVLKRNLEAAEALIQPLKEKANPTRNEKLYRDRMRFTRLSYGILENYMAMVHAAATEVDYAAAAAAGAKGLALREEMTAMSGTFTTYKHMGENGPMWWPGEVQQYRNLAQYTAGTNGTLVQKSPLEWAFCRDPLDQGVKEKWAETPPEMTYWNEKGRDYTPVTRKDYPSNLWEMLRTDLYIQAQGVRAPDEQSYTGYAWYRTEIELTPAQAAQPLHLLFPGLFNECWLYVNGPEAAHRELSSPMWWHTDYLFQWDVNLAGKLKPGKNILVLRIFNPHHFGGMFRRPFLYTPKP